MNVPDVRMNNINNLSVREIVGVSGSVWVVDVPFTKNVLILWINGCYLKMNILNVLVKKTFKFRLPLFEMLTSRSYY